MGRRNKDINQNPHVLNQNSTTAHHCTEQHLLKQIDTVNNNSGLTNGVFRSSHVSTT